MTLLLLLAMASLLLHTTNSSVYIVISDDHYYTNTTCHHCHNLHHYLLNTTKYFTSNTQLLYLPGLHHLHTDLIVQNVHSISLIGTTTNSTHLATIIDCNSKVNIAIKWASNVVIKHIILASILKYIIQMHDQRVVELILMHQ